MLPTGEPADLEEKSGESEEARAERLSSLLHRASALITSISQYSDIEVVWGESGSENFYTPSARRVTLDPQDADNPEVIPLGISGHEGMHARITRLLSIIPENVKRTDGFNMLMQTCEDVRVNHAIEVMYPGAGEWIRQAIHDLAVDPKGRMSLESQLPVLEETFGGIPRTSEFCINLQKYWVDKSFRADTSPDVMEALQRVAPFVLEYSSTIPAKEANEDEVIKLGYRSYEILYGNIWPVYLELYVADLEDAETNALLNRLSDSKYADDLELLKLELDEEELAELNGQLQTIAKKRAEKEAALASATGAAPSQATPSLAFVKQHGNSYSFVKSGAQIMSAGLKKKLKSFKETSYSRSTKQALNNEGQETMNEIEDTIVKILRGKMISTEGQETHAELSEAKEKEDAARVGRGPASRMSYEERALLQAKEAEQDLEKAPANIEIFNEAYRDVARHIEDLAAQLGPYFSANQFPRWVGGHSSGTRISIAEAMAFEADPRRYDRLYERKTHPTQMDYKLGVLVDLSGSMYRRIGAAMRAGILYTGVFDRLGFDSELMGFNCLPLDKRIRDNYVFKKAGQGFDPEARAKISKMIPMVEMPGAAYNDDAPALLWAGDRLMNLGGTHSFLIVISDGEPYPSPYYKEDPYSALHDAVEQLSLRRNLTTIGVGVGDEGVRAVETFYPTRVLAPDISTLTTKSAELIRNLLEGA